jgi:hypothetical protein
MLPGLAAPPTPPAVVTATVSVAKSAGLVPAVPVQPAASNETAAPSTTVPAVETKVVPAVETTAVPAVETTAVPALETTAVPAVETTAVPAVETTAVKAVETPAVKAVETTAVPAIETTAVPAKPADTEVSDQIRKGADYRVNSMENFHNYEASYEINIPYNDYIVSGRRNFNE